MSQYRFTLDSIHVLNDMPIGWDESEITIKRDKEIKGLFISYITDLKFYGDGYDYLKGQRDFWGHCKEIDILIEYKCEEDENFETLFEGIIRLRDIEWDEDKCFASCDIQDNNLSALLLDRSEIPVNLYTTLSLSGEVLTQKGQNVVFLDPNDGVSQIGSAPICWTIFNSFKHILEYISDNQITFVSDFFSVNYPQLETWEVEYTGVFVAGNVITVQYTNYFGQSQTASAAYDSCGNPYDTTERLFGYKTTTSGMNTVPDEWDFSTFMGTDDFTFNPKIILSTPLPYSNISISITGGASQPTVSVTKKQNFIYGMRDLVIANGFLLRGGGLTDPSKAVNISFKDLFVEMSKYFNLSFSLKNISSVPTLRIEPTSYFFTQTQSIRLENVPNLKYKISDAFSRSKIKIGDANVSQNNDDGSIFHSKYTWIDEDGCSESEINANNTLITANWEEIEAQVNGSAELTNDTKLYIVQTRNYPNISATNRTDNNEFVNTNIPFFTHYNVPAACSRTRVYFYNTFITNYHKIRNWLFNLSGDVKNEGRVITNDVSLKLEREYEFEYPLSYDQIKTLINNTELFITFNKGTNPGDDLQGYIQEVKFKIKTGLTKFNLLTT